MSIQAKTKDEYKEKTMYLSLTLLFSTLFYSYNDIKIFCNAANLSS